MKEIKNAKIESTSLGIEGHGIFSCMIHLDYGGTMQGFGGYCLDQYDKIKKERLGTAYGMQFIIKILDTLEISCWEKLPGAVCRVEADHGKIYRIGHFMKDKWFNPEEDLKEFIN